jgi:hypothetical protein
MQLPFSEKKLENTFIRTFSADLDSNELKWHKDLEDRIVSPISATDWLFQRENELPTPINQEIKIKANEWHRIIKGSGDLVVKVIKLPNSSL